MRQRMGDTPPTDGGEVVDLAERRRQAAMVLATARRQTDAAATATRPCRVCQLDPEHKEAVEQLLGLGVAERTVVRTANLIGRTLHGGRWQNLTSKTLRSHRDKHLPVRLALMRDIMEKHARNAHLQVEDNPSGSILTPGGYAEIMMTAAASNMVDDPSGVTPSEGLKAAQTLREIESADDSAARIAQMEADLDRIIRAVREVCTSEQAARIARLVEEGGVAS